MIWHHQRFTFWLIFFQSDMFLYSSVDCFHVRTVCFMGYLFHIQAINSTKDQKFGLKNWATFIRCPRFTFFQSDMLPLFFSGLLSY